MEHCIVGSTVSEKYTLRKNEEKKYIKISKATHM